EAAACGTPPIVARHSGLAEVAEGLEAEYPERLRHLAAFDTGQVGDLRAKLRELLELGPGEREALRAAARRAVVERWSWATIAARLLGDSDELRSGEHRAGHAEHEQRQDDSPAQQQ